FQNEEGEQLFAAVNVDISERKQAEVEKEKLESRLVQAQKMEAIGTLAGGIAHDFNNILSVIFGYSEIAKEDAPPGTRFQKDLDQVLTGANRAKDLVQQILSFSRQSQVERMPMKIQPLIKEGLKMLRSSLPTTISITNNIDPNCQTVLADPTQIHQILTNLCTNAFHAMETTGGELAVTLKTTFVDTDEQAMLLHVIPSEYVELTVSDTGSGIGPDVIKKIFDPYFTTKGVGKGTGMGLAIIHGILKEYGGAITAESQLGIGTTFHVYFPVIQKEALPEREESTDIPMGKERVLFVDDEELLAEMGQAMLERLGYHVTVRRSSLEALETFQNTPNDFDLVITDQTMPNMTGSDLARRMMQIRPDIPIILCTGYSNIIDEDSAKGLGIKEFALKPLTKDVIAKLIRKVLDA
ncbi:MAG: ATP-binding protein, partial [candidate division Zixibacteria bacterium]|nr:ATP-binding protein [candidate division Zixibacteria bacterium]